MVKSFMIIFRIQSSHAVATIKFHLDWFYKQMNVQTESSININIKEKHLMEANLWAGAILKWTYIFSVSETNTFHDRFVCLSYSE